MKKLVLTGLFYLFFYHGFSQSIINRGGVQNTIQDARFMAKYNLFLPRYADTTDALSANNEGIDSCGAMIFTYDVNAIWYRQCSPKKWILLSNGNAPEYTADRGVQIITGDIIRLADTVEGAGTKFQYLYDKAAFRVGSVNGTQWDISNIGLNSFASGINTIASGSFGIAMGVSSQATGISSVAIGSVAIASGTSSTAFGNTVTASGSYGLATGLNTTASGQASTATGNFTKSVGNGSLSTGVGTYMNTLNGAVFGSYNDTTGYYANNTSTQVATDPIFTIGNGSGVGVRANAFQMLRNGATKFSSGITSTTDTTTFKPTVMDASGNFRKVDSWGIFGGWNLNGNAGTNPATNFLGTTDDNNVVFGRNGVEVMELTSKNRIQFNAIDQNIFVDAGNDLLTGSGNTGLGNGVLANLTTGSGNVGIGVIALEANTTGIGNVGIGSLALVSNTIGQTNVAIGSNTMEQNIDGIGNMAIGGIALRNNTSGDYNSAIGVSALLLNETGDYNTGIGSQALSDNINGVGNIGIGFLSAQYCSGDYNIGIGWQSAISPALTNAIAIGKNASATISNSLILGGINGVNSATADTKVGIGTTAPAERLDIVGNIQMDGKLLIPTGSNKTAGKATMILGTITVNTTQVGASSIILLTAQETGSLVGSLRVSARVVGTSFTITSTDLTDTAEVGWLIIN